MGDPKQRLFTPGPLTTSAKVKEAMLRDMGSRDGEFIGLIREVRRQLLELGGVSQAQGYEAVLMQGSGTFGVEAVLSSAVPPAARMLLLTNGAYGERMVQMAARWGIAHDVLRTPENLPPDPRVVRQRMSEIPQLTHVAMVHCETTTGILNPISEVGQFARELGKIFIVDAMSSFGGIPIDLGEAQIDFLVSSANKCIEGVPGFSFILGRRAPLEACAGQARSLSLDLYEQWRGLEANGQFRFTPPTHALLAFAQALAELAAEGGIAGRGGRYGANHRVLLEGMKGLGFVPFLAPEHQSCIITAFLHPGDPRFNFEEFYIRLARRGMIIYPGKVGRTNSFRIGSIGRLYESDMRALLESVEGVLEEMGVSVPVAAPGEV